MKPAPALKNRGVDPMRPLLPPEQLWLRSDELFSELKKMAAGPVKKTERLAEKAAHTNLGYQPPARVGDSGAE